MGFYSFLNTGNVMNVEFCFEKLIDDLYQIDYQRYQQGNLAKPVQYSLKSHHLLKKSHIQSE